MAKSKAQEFASKRNFAGGLLKGIITNLDNHVYPRCSAAEAKEVRDAIEKLEGVQDCWSDNYEQAKEENL